MEGKPATVTPPKDMAGGLPAVVSSLKHAVREMGIVRTLTLLPQTNQTNGFDCPGCAWPDPEDSRAHTEFCENGAKAVAEEATLKRATPEFFARHSVSELTGWSDMEMGKSGRLTHPLYLCSGSEHYEPVSWDDAFARIAAELNGLDSPDEAAFYTSGRTSNEAAFLYQLFVRQFGTNNLPDCSNMCHESSGYGMGETLGTGKSTVTLEEIEHADALFIIGQNPGTNHPRMLSSLQKAVRNGAKIMSVNPLPETGTTRFAHPQEPLGMLGRGTVLATLHLPVRINGDVAFLKGVTKTLLEREDARPGHVLDGDFVAEHTEGFAAFAHDLRETSWDDITEGSGLARAEIEKAADIAAHAQRLILCWAMGLTQHKNGVANVQELVNLVLMLGMIGNSGAGLCCVRGHSNVQGDRSMGIWEKMPETFLQSLENEFGFTAPRRHGLDTVQSLEAMRDGKVKVFVGMGGNFLSATPDTEVTARALRNCALTVQISTKLNRGHLITGREALILPCLGRTERDIQQSGEQFVTVEDSLCWVHASRGTLPPASEHLRSETAIVAGLANAVFGQAGKSRTDWLALAADYHRIREHISHVVPGFHDFNARVAKAGGFYLGNPARERVFPTPTGKAQFTVHPIPRHELAPGQFLTMTIRSHDQFNTTIYGLDDRYRGIHNGRRVIFLHPDDVRDAGFAPGDRVDITSHFGSEQRHAPGFTVVPYSIPRRCAATYYPETNVLVPLQSVADGSNTPTSKSVVISLRRSE